MRPPHNGVLRVDLQSNRREMHTLDGSFPIDVGPATMTIEFGSEEVAHRVWQLINNMLRQNYQGETMHPTQASIQAIENGFNVRLGGKDYVFNHSTEMGKFIGEKLFTLEQRATAEADELRVKNAEKRNREDDALDAARAKEDEALRTK